MRPGIRIATLWTSAACLLLGLCGCSARPSRGDVQRDWALTLRELGVQPVFPPREDLHVGDIYLRRGRQDDASLLTTRGYIPLDLWVASLETVPVAMAFYGRRPSFPATTDLVAVAASPAGAGEATAVTLDPASLASGILRVPSRRGPDGNIFADRNPSSLRQVAFPDFASMSIRAANLQGLVPVEALTIAFGADWDTTHQVDVKIPVAESYGLPAAALLAVATQNKGTAGVYLDPQATGIPLEYLDVLRQGLRDAGPPAPPRGAPAPASEGSLHFEIITEVFYTRVLDVSIAKSSSFGSAVAVKTIDSAARNAVTDVAGGVVAGQPEGAAAPAAREEAGGESADGEEGPAHGALTAQERAEALNLKLEKIDRASEIGGSARFLAVSDSAVQMRRTFERPIAIGFRGISLEVDPVSGRVLAGAAANRSVLAMTTAGQLSDVAPLLDREIRASLQDFIARAEFQEQGRRLTILIAPKAPRTFEEAELALRGRSQEIYEAVVRAKPEERENPYLLSLKGELNIRLLED